VIYHDYALKPLTQAEKIFPDVYLDTVGKDIPSDFYENNTMDPRNTNVKDTKKTIKETIKSAIQPIGTRIRFLSKEVGNLVEKTTYIIDRLKLRFAEDLMPLGDTTQWLRKDDPKTFSDLNFALYNRDIVKLKEIYEKYPGLEAEVEVARKIWKEIYGMSLEVGIKSNEMQEYRPREIKDFQ